MACGRGARRAAILLAWLLVALALAAAILVLGLRLWMLPHVDEYRPRIEQALSRELGLPVTLRAIAGDWSGPRPKLELTDLHIARADGSNALHIAHASAVVAWRSLLVFEPRLHRLSIDAPELDVRRSADGRWSVAGIAIDPDAAGDGRFGELLLAQDDIEIRHASVAYTDAMRSNDTLHLRDVGIVMQNSGRHHRFGLQARPPGEIATRIDLRGDFTHSAFARRSADWRVWSGELYADLGTADLGEVARHAPAWLAALRGRGTVRGWLTLDDGRIERLTADVELERAVVRVSGDLPALDIADASGRIVARELPHRELEGADHGHEVSLQHFGFRLPSGLTLPPAEISERLVFDADGAIRGGALSSSTIELQALGELAEHLPIGSARAWLARFEPRGRVTALDYRWQGRAEAPSRYALKAGFDKLALRSQPASDPPDPTHPNRLHPGVPGFSNLSGRVDFDQSTGMLQVDSAHPVLEFPGVFEVPAITFDALSGRVDWQHGANGWKLVFGPTVFAGPQASGSFSGRYERGASGLGTIDVEGRIDQAQASTVHLFLPISLPERTRSWVERAFAAGVAEQGAFRVRGDLAKFPFVDARDGDFRIAAKMRDVTMNVAPAALAADGQTPLWPALTELRGDLVFERNGFSVSDATLKSQGVAMHNVSVRMANFADPRHVLEASGQSMGPLRAIVDYANASPVGRWLGNVLREANVSGDAKLGLRFALPIAALAESTVQGDLTLANDDIALSPVIPPFTRAIGRVDFNEKGASVHGLSATFLGGPLRVDGGPRADGVTVLRAEGTATVEGLRKQYEHPVFEHASGQTRYTAQLVLGKGRHGEFSVDSTLSGVALALPAPMRKDADTAMPLHLDIVPAVADERTRDVYRDEVRMSIGETVKFAVEREARDGAPTRVVRGALGVNAPADLPGAGTVATIQLGAVDVDAWRQIIGDRSHPAARSNPADPAASGPIALDDMPEPFIVNLRAESLTLAGKRFDRVVMGATQSDLVWAISVDARQAEGSLQWKRAGPGLPAGRLTARLARLQLEQAQASDVVRLLDEAPAEEVPALDVIIDEFAMPQAQLGRLEMEANNTGRGVQARWELKRLHVENPDGSLEATGAWAREVAGVRHMQLDFSLDVKDAGRFLERLGFKNQVRSGTAHLEGAVGWRGSPLSLDLPSLAGELKFEAARGQFLKVEPGAARLLSVMSLQSIPRRLTFDFRDVFAEGFSFDTIRATSTLRNGVLETKDFRMRGPSATVLLEGGVDLPRETQNLHLVVLPQLDATGASVAYGFLVNPAIGLGTFLAQLLLKDPLSKALAFEYNVTGSWLDPQVDRVRHAPAPNGAPAG